MSFWVPEIDSSNDSSNGSFYDLPNCPRHETFDMPNDSTSNSDIPMKNAYNLEFLVQLNSGHIQNLIGVVAESRATQLSTSQSRQKVSHIAVRHIKDVQLSKWN